MIDLAAWVRLCARAGKLTVAIMITIANNSNIAIPPFLLIVLVMASDSNRADSTSTCFTCL